MLALDASLQLSKHNLNTLHSTGFSSQGCSLLLCSSLFSLAKALSSLKIKYKTEVGKHVRGDMHSGGAAHGTESKVKKL